VFQNTLNLDVSEVFETFTYRTGFISGRFSFSATVGLFTSLIGMILIFTSNRLAKVIGEEGLF
jgi:putative aldouronate transport system permease protein